MDPVYTVPYPEFCVAQRLSQLLPTKQGYSLFAPLSRQERGVDLILTRRRRSGTTVATVQVKSSRTYSRRPRTRPSKQRLFRYYTWFKTFICPPEADFFCLVTLYPAVDAAEKRELGSWWSSQILLFSQTEMRSFLRSVRTKAGNPDRMFGFAFDVPTEAALYRGDSRQRFADYSDHLLERRVRELQRFITP
jgi:hypothetical protein